LLGIPCCGTRGFEMDAYFLCRASQSGRLGDCTICVIGKLLECRVNRSEESRQYVRHKGINGSGIIGIAQGIRHKMHKRHDPRNTNTVQYVQYGTTQRHCRRGQRSASGSAGSQPQVLLAADFIKTFSSSSSISAPTSHLLLAFPLPSLSLRLRPHRRPPSWGFHPASSASRGLRYANSHCPTPWSSAR
jgi:hypothetical protein